MTEKEDKECAAIAGYFDALCCSEMFKVNFIDKLKLKAEIHERTLTTESDTIEIYRAQGALRIIGEVFNLLTKQQEKFNRSKQGAIYARTNTRSS